MIQYSDKNDVIKPLVLWCVKTLILLLCFWWVGVWAVGKTLPTVTMTMGGILTTVIGVVLGGILDAIIGKLALTLYFIKWFIVVLVFFIGMSGLDMMGYYSLLISIPLGLLALRAISLMTIDD